MSLHRNQLVASSRHAGAAHELHAGGTLRGLGGTFRSGRAPYRPRQVFPLHRQLAVRNRAVDGGDVDGLAVDSLPYEGFGAGSPGKHKPQKNNCHQHGAHLARVFALVTTLMIPFSAHAEIRITDDRGGNVAAYAARVQAVRASGERVVIDGPCQSACTLYLNLPRHQICATPKAVLGFHSAVDAQFGFPAPETNQQMMSAYPPAVRAWISSRGGLWLNVIRVAGRKFLQPCN